MIHSAHESHPQSIYALNDRKRKDALFLDPMHATLLLSMLKHPYVGKMVVMRGAVLYTQGGSTPCSILAETLRGGFLDQ